MMERKGIPTDAEILARIQNRAEAIRGRKKPLEKLRQEYEQAYKLYKRNVLEGVPSAERYVVKEAFRIVLEEREKENEGKNTGGGFV